MKTDLFQHELTNTSAVFGRQTNVRVVFEGEGAKTDHETIWLPSLPKGVEIEERERDIFRGYTDHEAGHLRHTDRKALEKAQDKFRANPRLHSVWNALEDVWLERRVIDEYPGARKNLVATSSAVDQQALDNIAAGDERWKNDKFVGPVAITWEGRKDYGHDTGLKCLERVSDALRRQLPVWVKALDACKNTKDVLKLAEVIHGELESGSYKTPGEEGEDKREGDGKPGNGEGQDGEGNEGDKGEGQKGSGDAEGEGDGDADGGRDGRSSGGSGGVTGSRDDGDADDEEGDDEELEDGKDVKQQTEEGGTNGGTNRGNVTNDYASDPGVYDDFKLEDLVKREAKKLTAEASGAGGAYRPYTTARDKWHTRFDADKLYGNYTYGKAMRDLAERWPLAYQERLAKSSGSINVVRRKLERVLASQQNRGWEGGHEQGKFDSRKMVQAYRAEAKVYKVREPLAEIDTAVQLLVDLSGSMAAVKASVAADVVCVLVEVMAKVGIAVEVLGFNAKSGHFHADGERIFDHPWQRDYGKSGGGFSRYEPIDMYVFKAFDERLSDARPYIGNLSRHAGGNNIDGESLMMAYPRLAKRHERRKILMTLSDGAPAGSSTDNYALYRHLTGVVKHLAKSRVECIGIGIQTDAVARFYPRHVVVNSLEDLATRAIDQLAKVLVGERYVVDNASLMGAA